MDEEKENPKDEGKDRDLSQLTPRGRMLAELLALQTAFDDSDQYKQLFTAVKRAPPGKGTAGALQALLDAANA